MADYSNLSDLLFMIVMHDLINLSSIATNAAELPEEIIVNAVEKATTAAAARDLWMQMNRWIWIVLLQLATVQRLGGLCNCNILKAVCLCVASAFVSCTKRKKRCTKPRMWIRLRAACDVGTNSWPHSDERAHAACHMQQTDNANTHTHTENSHRAG